MSVDDWVKVLDQVFKVLLGLAVILFGYFQWRGGARHDQIGSSAEHMVKAATGVVELKESEIVRLNEEKTRMSNALNYLVLMFQGKYPRIVARALRIARGELKMSGDDAIESVES